MTLFTKTWRVVKFRGVHGNRYGIFGCDFVRLWHQQRMSEFISEAEDPFQFLRHGDHFRRLRELFARNISSAVISNSIPHRLHRIWLGSPQPEHLQVLERTWLKYHPEWEYTFWDDKKVRDFDFPSRDLFDQAEDFGQKSDILRIEILKRFGGVYVDCDFECYRSLLDLASSYEFFAGVALLFQAHLGWPAVYPTASIVNNAIIASRPGHPLLDAYLQRVRAGWNNEERWRLRPGELSKPALWAMGGRAKAARLKEVSLRTLLPFDEVVVAGAGADSRRDIVFPPRYFYPRLGGGLSPLLIMPPFWKKVLQSGGALWKAGVYDRIRADSYAHHHSHVAWL